MPPNINCFFFFRQSDCFPIESSVAVTHDIIKVECRSPFNSIYSNVHHIIQPVPKSVKTDKPSILLLGIDGMSKLNFMRSMPKTFTYLESYDWIGLKGYNKIEDNTYPNLMAFLTGQNWTDSDKLCDPTVIGKLDGCNFIWKEFKKLGYTTAYGEDTKVSTFNYLKKGFLNPPTDVYLKPYVIASLNLSTKWYCSTYYCSGPENAGQRMLDSVLDFSVTYKNVPTFGLFWINTFSHDDINCATSMDADVEMLLRKLYVEEILNDTIVVLLSDHGFRYGNIRYTHTGYMEERLPFIYFWIPEGYRKRYVKEYEELKRNAQRLTSPYDLYMTLQHVLKQVDPKYVIKESRGCSKCHSLMEPIKNDRICSDAGIPDYYCSCTKYFTTSLNRPIVKELGEFLVGEINAKVASYGSEAKGCAYYILYKVLSVKSLINKDKNEETFLIKIKTFPETIMEASINVNYAKHVFKIVDNISRLDRYGPRSYCVKGSKVSYYCYCKSIFMYVNHVLCNNIFCFL